MKKKTIILEKICVANSQGEFLRVFDGFPSITEKFQDACLFNKEDEVGRKKLEEYLNYFSNPDFAINPQRYLNADGTLNRDIGESDGLTVYNLLNGFGLVTVKITYAI